MPKVIIRIANSETALKLQQLLIDIRDGRCGLRAIAHAIRRLLHNCTIEHDED